MRGQLILDPDISVPSWSELAEEVESFRRGAVMVPLVMTEKGTRLLLILRPENMREHAGQIAFPGGSMDDGDRSPWETACREAYEEVGIPDSSVEFVSLLPAEKVLVSNFKIYPVLTRIKGSWSMDDFKLNSSEVDRVYLCDLTSFSEKADVRSGFYKGIPYEFPIYPLEDGVTVWGATARIVRNLLSVIKLC